MVPYNTEAAMMKALTGRVSRGRIGITIRRLGDGLLQDHSHTADNRGTNPNIGLLGMQAQRKETKMRKFIVVIFPNETKAYEGTRAFQDLNAEGSLTLYGMSVVVKSADGTLSVKQAADQGPLGTASGMLAGALIGLLGGPVGAALGLGGGALIGGAFDLVNLGVSADFIQKVSQELTPGRAALITDVDEEWVTPLDTRMEAIGGVVVREWRTDFEDDQHQREVNARKA